MLLIQGDIVCFCDYCKFNCLKGSRSQKTFYTIIGMTSNDSPFPANFHSSVRSTYFLPQQAPAMDGTVICKQCLKEGYNRQPTQLLTPG